MTHAVVLSSLEQIDNFEWIALERAVGRYFGPDAVVSYGAEVHGGCLEPGYRLQSQSYLQDCPECGRYRCVRDDWEEVEGGSMNFYYSLSCDACGLFEPELWNVS